MHTCFAHPQLLDSARALAAEKAEGERLRAHLSALKEQLLQGQDDEEEALAWRVEAEVRLVTTLLT